MSDGRIVPALGTGACIICGCDAPEWSLTLARRLPYACEPCLNTHTITNLCDGTLHIEPHPHAACMPGWCVLPPSDPRHENHPVPTHGGHV
jgi:hypothetical protein